MADTWDDDDYERDPDLPDECEHQDYDADILTGRAICYRCGHAWWQTSEEIQREVEHVRQYAEWEAEQYRRENLERHWWGRTWLAITDWAARLIGSKP